MNGQSYFPVARPAKPTELTGNLLTGKSLEESPTSLTLAPITRRTHRFRPRVYNRCDAELNEFIEFSEALTQNPMSSLSFFEALSQNLLSSLSSLKL